MPVKKKMHNSVFHCPAILPFVKHKLSTWFPTCPRRLSATLLACQHSLRVIVRVKKHNATQLALHGATLLACENHRCQPVLHMRLWMVRQFRLHMANCVSVRDCKVSCERGKYNPTYSPRCPTTHHNHTPASTQHRTIVRQETSSHQTISIVP
jgi:hypothetical protein